MTEDLNPRAVMGGNQPPAEAELSPWEVEAMAAIDEAMAPHGDTFEEIANWLDGQPIQNADQMKAVDKLSKSLREARKELAELRSEKVTPLHDAWKLGVATFARVEADQDRMQKGLAAIGDKFKKEEKAKRDAEAAAAKAEAERKAQEAADAQRKAAENEGDLEAQREAAALQEQAKAASKQAGKAVNQAKEIKGLHTVKRWRFEVDPRQDPQGARRAALLEIMRKDPAAICDFVDAYINRNFRDMQIAGVIVYEEKEAR